jgi:hypothetical protein
MWSENSESLNLKNSKIDALQALVDIYGPSTPLKIIGDLNVQLPTQLSLSPGWHKRKGFNSHCSIMYDFMCCNDFIVADFLNEQQVNYTYFCHTTGNRSWIDHCLTTSYDTDTITSCSICPLDEDNLSDHLPIKVTIQLQCKTIIHHHTHVPTTHREFVPARWDNCSNNNVYNLSLREKLLKIKFLNNCEIRQSDIDGYVDAINQAIHDAAREAGCTQRKTSSPNHSGAPGLPISEKRNVSGGDCGMTMGAQELDVYLTVIKTLKNFSGKHLDNQLIILPLQNTPSYSSCIPVRI